MAKFQIIDEGKVVKTLTNLQLCQHVAHRMMLEVGRDIQIYQPSTKNLKTVRAKERADYVELKAAARAVRA